MHFAKKIGLLSLIVSIVAGCYFQADRCSLCIVSDIHDHGCR